MVGAPGSGKADIGDQYWTKNMDGMDKVIIDPDQWSDVFKHDQSLRMWFNYLNHETFLKAMRAGRPMIFDGTGKDLQNTCGRVLDRLHEQGYQVTILIVLASFETCLKRIEERRGRTKRNVPQKIVKDTFTSLAKSVPFYRTELKGTTVVVMNNDGIKDKHRPATDNEITGFLASHNP